MRIDYFLVSETLKERIVACEMHGHGIELEGKFLLMRLIYSFSIAYSKKDLNLFLIPVIYSFSVYYIKI